MTKIEELTERVKKLEELVSKITEVLNNNANKTLEVDNNLDLVVRKLAQQGIKV